MYERQQQGLPPLLPCLAMSWSRAYTKRSASLLCPPLSPRTSRFCSSPRDTTRNSRPTRQKDRAPTSHTWVLGSAATYHKCAPRLVDCWPRQSRQPSQATRCAPGLPGQRLRPLRTDNLVQDLRSMATGAGPAHARAHRDGRGEFSLRRLSAAPHNTSLEPGRNTSGSRGCRSRPWSRWRSATPCDRMGATTMKDAFRLDALDFDLPVHDPDLSFAHGMVVLGAWFLCREIELVGLRVKHMNIDSLSRQVTFTLASSKTDTVGNLALVQRKHSCYCGVVPETICPYTTRLSQTSAGPIRRTSFSQLHAPGTPLSKPRTIEMIHDVLRAAGISLSRPGAADEPEVQRFGGHCLRVSGA